MKISDKARQQAESCRFCWMCRHVCPVGNADGQERNTARARALLVSYVLRGTEKLPIAVEFYQVAQIAYIKRGELVVVADDFGQCRAVF